MEIVRKLLIYPFLETKNNLYKQNKKISFNSPLYLSIFFFIFINLTSINITLSKQKLYYFTKLNLDSEITMSIFGIGQQEILSREYRGVLPDKIYVDNIYSNEKSKLVNIIDKNENIIKMVWNSPIKTCRCMFKDLSNIIGIDFTKFDSSLVTDMYLMFNGCYSLTSINFNNFNTSKVTNMESMFYNCSLLTSLDLNYFDTSSVTNMIGMFHKCISLQNLKVDYFNTSSVNDMNALFYNCKSLISLDLSSFDTSLVTNMF